MNGIPSTELGHLYRVLQAPDIRGLSWRSPLRPAVRVLRALRMAAGAARRYGTPVARAYGVGLSRQTLKLWRLYLRNGFTADDFYRFRMYRMSAKQASLFVPLKSNIAIRSELYRRLTLDADALADKRRFGRACALAGLPMPSTVADLADREIHWWGEAVLPPCDLFVKEAASMCGAGAAVWTFDGRGRWSSGSMNLDAPALRSHLAGLSVEAPILVQQRLLNHPELAELGPSGLCTARVVTVRAPAAERAEILLAAFRMPSGNDVADNFARGGLACAIDVVAGTLGAAVRKDLSVAHLDLERHPDTGARIAGRQLPCWQEVLDLALRAHDSFAQYPSVGWDIAITPDGARLLEANYNWDVVLGQQAGCRPLGGTSWPQHSLDWFRWTDSRAPAQTRTT